MATCPVYSPNYMLKINVYVLNIQIKCRSYLLNQLVDIPQRKPHVEMPSHNQEACQFPPPHTHQNHAISNRILLLIGICFSSKSENSNLLLDRCLGKMPVTFWELICALYSCVYTSTHSGANKWKSKQK